MADIQEFHSAFYSSTNKQIQDTFILKYIDIKKTKRDRAKKPGSTRKKIALSYFVKVHHTDKFQMQVCQKTFLNILHVTKSRVQRVANRYTKSGQMPVERRGGARLGKYAEKRISVKRFIEKFKCTESHYCRGKSTRQYLSCGLSIKKIMEMYNNSHPSNLKVKRSFFRKIFTVHFNIGFGTPVTDACSRCIELTERMKNAKDNELKKDLMIEKRVHKLRSKAFYEILREEKQGMLTFSYDCQKNLVNPKIPDQVAYYSRQLYTYHFAVVKGTSHSALTKKNVFSFTWMEHEYQKSSNEIASAVFYLLSSTDMENITKTRLCADGCGGQNRNSVMVGMLVYFLGKIAPLSLKEIELVFPVRGHSFLPSDRVFGRIERKLKKMPIITNPNTYIELFEENAVVLKLENCHIRDWKKSVKECFKGVQSWHFKFSQCKRIVIEKQGKGNVTVRGEEYYRTDAGKSLPLWKRGKNISKMVLYNLPKGVPVKPHKVKDIHTLLKSHFGPEWKENRECDFFKHFVEECSNNANPVDASLGKENDNFCEYYEENIDLVI